MVSPCLSDLKERPSDSSQDPPSTERDEPAQCTVQDEVHISGARIASDTMPSRQRRWGLEQLCSSLHPQLGTLLGQKRLDLSEYLHMISAGHYRTWPE